VRGIKSTGGDVVNRKRDSFVDLNKYLEYLSGDKINLILIISDQKWVNILQSGKIKKN
jgi:hypothetical protein